MESSITDIQSTGDIGSIVLWVLLVLALSAAVYWFRKKNKKK